MRVLHFYKTYITDSHGGVEQFIFQLANGAKTHHIETDVLSLTSEKETPILDLGTHRAHRSRLNFEIASTGFSTAVFSHFAKLAKQADIIHYHFPWPFMDLVHLVTRLKKPTVLTYHSDIIRQKNLLKIYTPLMHAFLKKMSVIVATSPQYVATSPILARYQEKTQIIPIGLDKKPYYKLDLERLNFWKNKLPERFFLFVGMLRYYKGLHILLDALKNLDYPVVIMGAGPLEEELKKQAQDLGLKNIWFLGALENSDKLALLNLCYAFVFPSHLRSEAFGISLLEAAMCGKPLISCEIGTGTTYINQANKTGIVIPPEDAQALREAMRFLWNNPEHAAGMGKQAQLRYEELFTADKMVEKYVDVYRQVVK